MRARPRRTAVIVGASTAAHVAVLTLLALHAPMLRVPSEPPGAPHAVIPILLLPRLPPPVPGQATPGPIRLHRRPQRLAAQPPPVAPLQAPKRSLEKAEGARKDALVRAREAAAPVGNGVKSPFAQAQDYDGEPYMSGAGVSLFGQPTHPPSKRAAKELGRLRP